MKISFAAVVLGIVVSGCAANNLASRPSHGLILSDDFESTPVGAIPTGFTKTATSASKKAWPTAASMP